MSGVITEILLKLGFDGDQAEQGIKSVKDSFTELNQALELVKKGFNLVTDSFGRLSSQIERGQAFHELDTAFKNLYGSSSALGKDGLGVLRTALKGTVDDLGILKSANIAAQAGLSPDAYLEVAKAAESLGDIVGKNAVDALQDLSRGLALGQERLLKQYGIIVDSTKANEAFAKSLGVTADKLSEAGKLAAFQAEATKQLAEKSRNAGDAVETAGDELEKLEVSLSNASTAFATAINRSVAFTSAMRGVREITEGVLGTLAAFPTNLSLTLERAFDTTTRAQIDEINQTIAARQADIAQLEKDRGLFGGNGERLKQWRDEVTTLQQKKTELEGVAQAQQKEAETAAIAAAAAEGVHGIGPIADAKAYGDQIKSIRDRFIDYSKGAKDAADAAKQYNEELANYDSIIAGLHTDDLKQQLDAAIESLDPARFAQALSGYGEALAKQTQQELADKFGQLPEEMRKALGDKIVQGELGTLSKDFAARIEDDQKEAFKNSVDFFSDILNDLFSGDGLDIEGLVTEQLKNAAVEFGSELLAQLTNSFSGFGGTGGFGNIISSFIGQYLGLGPSSNIGPVANGAQYGNMLSGANALSSVSIAQVAGIAAGAAVAYLQYDTANQIFSGRASSVDDLNAPNRATLAYSTFGFSELARLFGVDDNLLGLLGLSTDKNTLTRRAFRGQLQQTGLGDNLTFNTTTGSTSLFNSDYALRNRTSLTDSAIGLVNPIAALFSGGDLKKQSDFAGIFADAVDNGKDFASVLINVSSLLDKMGVSAEEAANQLKDSFLDQIGGAEQFLETLRGFRIIAAEDLPSVADALGGIGNEFETNRAQLKRLELAFKEFGQIGITSAEGIHDYLVANYPDLVDVFDQLAQQGIDTWEEIANATPEMIGQIIRILEGLPESVGKVFIKAGDAAADGFESGASRVITKIRNIQAEIQTALSLQGALEDGGDAGAGGGSSSSRGSGGVHLIQPRSITRGRNAGGVDENPRLARVS